MILRQNSHLWNVRRRQKRCLTTQVFDFTTQPLSEGTITSTKMTCEPSNFLAFFELPLTYEKTALIVEVIRHNLNLI